MSPFALRVRTLNAAALGNKSAFRPEDTPECLRPIYPACRSAWIRSSRVVTWFQLANVRFTEQILSNAGCLPRLTAANATVLNKRDHHSDPSAPVTWKA